MKTRSRTMARLAGAAVVMMTSAHVAFGFTVEEMYVQLAEARAKVQQAEDQVNVFEDAIGDLDDHMARLNRALDAARTDDGRRALQQEMFETFAQLQLTYKQLGQAEVDVTAAETEANRIQRSIDAANANATR